MAQKICVICGDVFETKSSRRSYCYKPHYHPCPICGKDVLTKDTYHLNECCCEDHSRQLAIKSTHEKYEIWPANSAQAKEKRKQTCLDRFGVENPSFDPEIKEKIRKNVIQANKEHPEYIQKRMDTYFSRTGFRTPAANPEWQAKRKQELLEKYGTTNPFAIPEAKAKADKTNLERYGTTIPMQNSQVWTKHRLHKSSYRTADDTPVDSTYEVDVYNYCLRNNIPIKRSVPIPYEYEGKQHKTFIDFEIDGMLVECKGPHILDGYYDNQPDSVPIAAKLEVYRKHHVILITSNEAISHFRQSNGLKYLNKCPEPLIGVDIELFRNPQFPYREDRPPCFYDVRVGGNRSSAEAFQDEQLRWDMIKNRINYVGGFISSKDILTALNVTRKCKQPSWFSVSFAEKLLHKYATSDVIVDPFAGWGTRHDACVRLHKDYIGCDLNNELVEWHKSQCRNISLGDAFEFKYTGDCNVFICPPYKDTEVYFDNQNVVLSQCEWLEVVRKNVPNASRYIMVCKVVDSGYEKYIVETKVNKSHFGTNREFVIVIDNNRTAE